MNNAHYCERCRRRSCAFYNSKQESACDALTVAYEDDQKCKFFKTKK